jgi:hypothetical protein
MFETLSIGVSPSIFIALIRVPIRSKKRAQYTTRLVALAVGCAVDVSIVNKRPKVNRVTITR